FDAIATLEEEEVRLQNLVNTLERPLELLDDRMEQTGLRDLDKQDIRLFSHDIGLGHLESLLEQVSGKAIATNNIGGLEKSFKLPYSDGCKLLLHATLVELHYDKSRAPSFP